MININPAQAFVVQIVERGSINDTPKLRASNEIIMLTCSEYMVFDMRSASERARIPSQKIVEHMYETTMTKLRLRIEELIEADDEFSLRRLLASLAPNAHTKRIVQYLENKGTPNAGHKKITI
jgi:translation initiation factor 2 beta subunit (eIF-2beta)/eIF-5